jgi:hypothetical protein
MNQDSAIQDPITIESYNKKRGRGGLIELYKKL